MDIDTNGYCKGARADLSEPGVAQQAPDCLVGGEMAGSLRKGALAGDRDADAREGTL